VGLKKGVMDAEGETIAKSLNLLGYPVSNVSTAKIYEVEVEAESKEKAIELVNEACLKLLVNPVINNFQLRVK